MSTSVSTRKSFEVVTTDLTALLESPHPPAGDRAEAMLATLSGRAALTALLDSLRSSERALAEVAARSYTHPLGFDKIVLLSRRPVGQLRLHLWWPRTTRVSEHIHNHRFGFSSAVVCGELQMRMYEVHASGIPTEHYEEVAEPGAQQWHFRRLGPSAVRCGLRTSMAAGTTYSMTADTLHRIDAAPSLTATLVLEGRSVRDHSAVHVGTGEQMLDVVARPYFTPAELAAKLDALHGQFAASPTAGRWQVCRPRSAD